MSGQFLHLGPFFVNGALVTAPKLYHYFAGTTTLQNLYTDFALTTTAAQPVIGDANGIVTAFAITGALYKFAIHDVNNVLLYTWDNVGILGGVTILTGTNTPEGAVTAAVGSLFLRTNGGAGTTLYVKESGTGNTGWVGK